MRIPSASGELTYCLNIHPGEGWAEVRSALTGPTRRIKSAISPDGPFAVGLRLSALAVADLAKPAAREELIEILATENYRAITVNGFPYGQFHSVVIKENVYRPDWREEARLDYTCGLAELMAAIAPEGEVVSLSTVPGAFRPLGIGAEGAIADRMLRAAAYCVELSRRTNVTIALAIEPEPFCLLETVEETATFFKDYLFSEAAVKCLAELTGLDRSAATDALPRHLGICFDVCHAAVEFEDPFESVTKLASVGVPIHKLQLSAALRLSRVSSEACKALAAFNEPTYLHQVVSHLAGRFERYADLPPALDNAASEDGAEWRIHYHVPVFVADLGILATTQDFLANILEIHRRSPLSKHLEVETYTFGVLPPELSAGSVEDDVVRELRWVLGRLDQ